MRKRGLRWIVPALLLTLLMGVGARADGNQAAPAQLMELPAAQVLTVLPALRLTDRRVTAERLPEGGALTASAAEGEDWPLTKEADHWTLPDGADPAWLTLRWRENGIGCEARYLIQASGCELWEASADDGEYQVTRRSGSFSLRLSLAHVGSAQAHYDTDGLLKGSVLIGDVRQPGTLPMTLQFDRYGRAAGITATDLNSMYTFNRARGEWLNEEGEAVSLDTLPVFDPALHPAPAALPLRTATIYRTEAGAGVDRAALAASAPKLTGFTVTDDTVTLVTDAEDALLLADGSDAYSVSAGTLIRTDGGYIAAPVEPGASLQITLRRGAVTALYQRDKLVSITDAALGAVLYADGSLTLSTGDATVYYSARGRLAQALIESPDGAVLTYNVHGRLTGWSMDGYSWTSDGGWRGTAVNANGNVIHPTVRAPAAVNLKSYPSLEIQEQ